MRISAVRVVRVQSARFNSPVSFEAQLCRTREEQVAVTELMPEVSFAYSRSVRGAHQILRSDGVEHGEMAGQRVMQSGDEPVHAVRRPARMDEYARESGDRPYLLAQEQAFGAGCT